jgi:multiple sugar transport system substrate-binding protein
MTIRTSVIGQIVFLTFFILSLAGCSFTPPPQEKTQVRWYIGLDTSASPEQIAALEEVTADFNNSQDQIELLPQIVTFGAAYDILATQFATGRGPDIVGPISSGTANSFPDQWLVLDSHIRSSSFDLTPYDPALLERYQNENGRLSLPFAVSPGAIFFIPSKFDEAGLAYPPQAYGEKYLLDGQPVDWSWDTLSEVAKRLTIDHNGINATQPGFDREHIEQVGFSVEGQSPMSFPTFFGATKIFIGNEGDYASTIPKSWKDAWRWQYDAMWGENPFMASGDLADAYEFGNGNIFPAGRSAMGLGQSSMTCCLTEFGGNGNEFQIAVLPASYDGHVHGRVADQSFYIWKESTHPQEAFQVLAYLVTNGSEKLLPAYDAMSADPAKTNNFLLQKSSQYPFVTDDSWNVLIQGLEYFDIPSADQYLPNRNEVLSSIQVFGDTLLHNANLDFDSEFQKLQDNLTAIYNKP